LSDIEPMKKPSSRSILKPHCGHSLFVSKKVPALKSVRPPQLGQRLVRPRAMICPRVTFIDEPILLQKIAKFAKWELASKPALALFATLV